MDKKSDGIEGASGQKKEKGPNTGIKNIFIMVYFNTYVFNFTISSHNFYNAFLIDEIKLVSL